METIPIIPEFVQYGVIGICVVLIVAMCYQTRLFVNAFLSMCSEIKALNDTIAKLTIKVEMLTYSHVKRRKQPQEPENDA